MPRLVLVLLVWPAFAVAAKINDYPTLARVEYVESCMREHDAPRRELMYKCSCVIDAIAQEMNHEQFIEAWTVANAISIAGERGSYIRDAQGAKELAGKFRSIQAKAKKSCFLN